MNEDDTTKSAVEIEMDDAQVKDPRRFMYSLVLAEIIYQTKKGIQTHRVQLFSKADVLTFPASRLGQLQNSAAHQTKNEVGGEDFKVLEVVILNILSLGWMTDEEFWGSKDNIPGTENVAPEGQAEPTAPSTGNVVSLKRP